MFIVVAVVIRAWTKKRRKPIFFLTSFLFSSSLFHSLLLSLSFSRSQSLQVFLNCSRGNNNNEKKWKKAPRERWKERKRIINVFTCLWMEMEWNGMYGSHICNYCIITVIYPIHLRARCALANRNDSYIWLISALFARSFRSMFTFLTEQIGEIKTHKQNSEVVIINGIFVFSDFGRKRGTKRRVRNKKWMEIIVLI